MQTSLLELLGRALLVLALLALTLWAVHRVDSGRRTTRAKDPVQVLSSTRLGKRAALTLVRVGDSTYALGVTDHTVTLIAETELPVIAVPSTSRPSFGSALQAQLGQLTHRRDKTYSASVADGTATGTTTAPDLVDVQTRKDAPATPLLEPAWRPAPHTRAFDVVRRGHVRS